MSRIYNFAAGPAVLPLEVLQEAQKNLVDYKGCGMSVMEMSHRGKDYDAIHQEAIATFKELCGLHDDWSVCFIQGGASLQFAMIPMNFLGKDQSADYANQGTWSNKALKQAQMIGTVNVVANCQKDSPPASLRRASSSGRRVPFTATSARTRPSPAPRSRRFPRPVRR